VFNGTHYSIQYATTTPKIFNVNSMATNCPRDLCSAVSVAQTGTMALSIPVPHPLIRRATTGQSDSHKQDVIREHTADHPDVVLSRSLKSSTNNGPASTKRDCLDSAISITERATDKTSHKSTEIVDGDNATLKQSVVDDWGAVFVCVAEFHGFLIIVWCRVDTTHHTLIITEKEDGQAGNTIDGNEKAALLKPVDHIRSWDQIHGGQGFKMTVDIQRVVTDLEELLSPAWRWRSRGQRR